MFFIVAMILLAALGYLAQTTGLCLVRGVKEATNGKPMFLIAILLSGSFAWVVLLIVNMTTEQSLLVSYQATWFSAIGGLLFGFGAAVNQGCGVSTISRLARGQLVMFATILGWLVGWILFATFISNVESRVFGQFREVHYIGLGLFSSIVVFVLYRFNKQNRKLWLSMLSIGIMASLVFLYEPHWTPSGLLKDISLSVWYGNESQWPSVERFSLMLSLIIGMVVAALLTNSFSFKLMSTKQAIRHLLAGLLMGIGAVLASGGNDTQLLLALPAFSPAGAVAVSCMIVGIYLGGKVSKVKLR